MTLRPLKKKKAVSCTSLPGCYGDEQCLRAIAIVVLTIPLHQRDVPERCFFDLLTMDPPVFYLSALDAAGYLLKAPFFFFLLLLIFFFPCSSLYLSPVFDSVPYFSCFQTPSPLLLRLISN